MTKSRILILAFVLVGGLLTAGTAWALSNPGGGDAPVRHAIPNAQETEEPDDQDDVDDETPEAEDVENDAHEADVDGPNGDDEAAGDKAALIAEEFGVSADDVLAQHDDGIGWGALFKLYSIARAKGVSVDDLISDSSLNADGEHEFAFGQMMQSLSSDEVDALDDGPKNLGQLVSGSKSHDHEDNDSDD
jgi:hypothetical protein